MSNFQQSVFIATVMILCFSSFICDSKQFPNYITVCHRNDPEISKCVRDSITRAKPFIANGMTELGILPIEPVKAYDVFSSQPAGPSKSIMMTVGTIKLYGCSNFIIRNLTIDLDEKKIDVDTYFPEIYVNGEYSASGNLIFLPVSGSGRITANYTNTATKLNLGWDLATNAENEVYMHATTIKLDISVNSAKHVYFENFMSDDKTLSELINVIINYGIKNGDGFWDIVSDEITKGVEKRLGPVFLEEINNMLRQFTYDEMFPVL